MICSVVASLLVVGGPILSLLNRVARKANLSLSCGDSRGNCSIQVFRRCVPDRRLGGVEQSFPARCSWEGKRKKPSISLFLETAARHEECRDCQSQSPDATRAHHHRGGSAHFSDNRHAVLSWASSTKPGGGKFPQCFLPVMYDCPPLLGLRGDSRGDSSIQVFRRCVPDRRLSGVEQNFSARCSWEGKRKKPSISLFTEITARREERRDCQSQSPDATPAHHQRGGSAH